jgi:hypothetical protein
MANEITVKVALDARGEGQKVAKEFANAAPAAQAAGRKIGDSLKLGIESGSKGAFDRPRDELGRFTKTAQDAGKKAGESLGLGIQNGTKQANAGLGEMLSTVRALQGVFAALAVGRAVSFFGDLAKRAIDAAVAVDRNVNSLRALTGSAEVAERRFASLVALAQKTPGLTADLAANLDIQLRTFNVAERTIDRLLPVIGRLNAISPLDSRQFARNLTQLISQNFDTQDLKELVQNSPVAGQLIQGIFDVNSPINGEAIRKSAQKLGITTVDRLAEALIKEAEGNSALRNATESLAGQFEKLQDRITVALAPIGKEIATVIAPAFNSLVNTLETEGPKIASYIRSNREEIELLGLALAGSVDQASRLVSALLGLDQNSGALRAIVAGITAVTNPGALNTVMAGFQASDELSAQRNRRNARLNAALPYGLNFGSLSTDIQTGNLVTPKAPKPPPSLGGNKTTSTRQPVDLFLSAERQTLENQRKFIEEQQRATDARMGDVFRAAQKADKIQLIDSPFSLQQDTKALQEQLTRLANADSPAELQRLARRDLGRSGRSVDDLLNRGAVTPEQAQALSQAANRQYAQQLREIISSEEKRAKLGADRVDDLQDEINLYDRLGSAISESERFMRGFNSATISLGDAFERFGQNVSQALLNTRNLLDGLKQSVLQFFNDLLGRSLQNIVGQALAPIAALFGGGGGQQAVAGGAGGILGNIFRTPSTVPQSVSSSAIQNLFQAAGGGISIPASVSSGVPGLPIFNANRSIAANPFPQFAGAAAGASGFSFSALGKSLGAAAPFLGFSVGSSLGGQSTTGNILGGIGGALGGLVAGASTGAIGGSLGSLFSLSGALGPAALVAAPLLIGGAILLGKAKQRRSDEEASGQYLTQALQAIDQLALGIQSGQIDGSQARNIFDSQILGPFKQQISQLKTKSVVQSRLTNQVRDLEKVYTDRIVPLIAQQIEERNRQSTNALVYSKQIPEFATGGIVPGINRGYDSVIARLTPGERVLNQTQQARIMGLAGSNIFERAGVPGVNASGRYATGGVVPASGPDDQPLVINIDAQVVMGSGTAEGIFVRGASTESGRRVIINQVRATQAGLRG